MSLHHGPPGITSCVFGSSLRVAPSRAGQVDARARVRMRQSSGRRLGEDSLGEAGVLVGPAPARRPLVGQLPRLMADAAHAVGHSVLPLQGKYPSVQPIQAPAAAASAVAVQQDALPAGRTKRQLQAIAWSRVRNLFIKDCLTGEENPDGRTSGKLVNRGR
jgi:hypothetical protein